MPLTERSGRRLRFDDPAVCKYDLGGLCPHGLFRNTKSDLGACTYEVHSDHIDWQVNLCTSRTSAAHTMLPCFYSLGGCIMHACMHTQRRWLLQ